MSDLPDFDLYATLEVSPDASPETIQAGWKRMLKLYHPDFGRPDPAERRAKRINIAHDWLSDPERRARYDSARAIRTRTAPTAAPPVPRSAASGHFASAANTPIWRAPSMPLEPPAPPRRLPIVVAVLIVLLAVLLFLAPSVFAPRDGTTTRTRSPAASHAAPATSGVVVGGSTV